MVAPVQSDANPDYNLANSLGGNDPLPGFTWLPPATNRLLAKYVPAPEAFHCPADRGMDSGEGIKHRPTVFRSDGCSYRFNHFLQEGYLSAGVADDPGYNLAGKKESWPPDPARFIMVHEPAAYPWDQAGLRPTIPRLEHGSEAGAHSMEYGTYGRLPTGSVERFEIVE